MIERVCPQCQHGNPLENRFCGGCGASLERDELVPRSEAGLPMISRAMPAELKRVSQTVAISLAALAAEAGLAWLRRRVERINTPHQSVTPQQIPVVQATKPTHPVPTTHAPMQSIVTIFSQRVVEVWDRDGIVRQTVERSVWRREG